MCIYVNVKARAWPEIQTQFHILHWEFLNYMHALAWTRLLLIGILVLFFLSVFFAFFKKLCLYPVVCMHKWINYLTGFLFLVPNEHICSFYLDGKSLYKFKFKNIIFFYFLLQQPWICADIILYSWTVLACIVPNIKTVANLSVLFLCSLKIRFTVSFSTMFTFAVFLGFVYSLFCYTTECWLAIHHLYSLLIIQIKFQGHVNVSFYDFVQGINLLIVMEFNCYYSFIYFSCCSHVCEEKVVSWLDNRQNL